MFSFYTPWKRQKTEGIPKNSKDIVIYVIVRT